MKKVLVVDDSPSIRHQLADVLEPEGYDVIQAADGSEGLAALGRHKDIGIIVLDVNMPVMDGLEMLEQLAAQSGGLQPPVVMLTTEGERSMIERAKKAGAKGWLIKPVRAALLLSAVSKLSR